MSIEIASLRRLIDVGRQLVSELEPDAVLQRILVEARQITGAHYAALGVLTDDRTKLSRFLTDGIEPELQRSIGELPHGRGVLGVLIDDPQPLRLADVSAHPRSSGFPPGHPPMRTFLGMPIMIRGQAWGNLYLAERHGGTTFTDADAEAVEILAQYAATAIENARLYNEAERGRLELGRAVRGLEAARTIADAVGIEPELERILELVVKRGRDLVNARSVLILLKDRDDLRIAAVAGRTVADERWSFSPIWALVRPRASMPTTSSSRLDRPPGLLAIGSAASLAPSRGFRKLSWPAAARTAVTSSCPADSLRT